MSDFLPPPSEIKNPWSAREIINFRLHFNSQWNAFISVSKHHINIQGKLSKMGRIDDPCFFSEITRSFPHTVQVHAWWTVFTFYHEAEHPMSCLDNVVKIQSYPVGQSSFTEKVLIYEIKKNYSRNKWVHELSTSLSIRHFDNDNENSRILPNALDGTLFTKRFERFVRNETLWERNGTLWGRNETFWERNETFW